MAIEISAKTRQAQGTGASRRLRKANLVPGIVYGTGEATMIELDHNTLYYALRNEAFHASILSLDLDGKKQSVLLRDFQMHPFRQQVQHIDFQRVDAKKKIHMKVPLHFINAEIAPGVKSGGGIISHVLNEVTLKLQPKPLLLKPLPPPQLLLLPQLLLPPPRSKLYPEQPAMRSDIAWRVFSL